MPKLIIMIGVQASGKSTFCKTKLAGMPIISLDILHTRYQEQQLFNQLLTVGSDLVVDNTNPRREDRSRYIAPVKALGYTIVGYYMQSNISACLARNASRKVFERISEVGVKSTFKRLELPSYDEGFDELYYVSMKDTGFKIDKWSDEDEI